MKDKPTFSASLLLALFSALAPTAGATTWYVNGVSGSDNSNCMSSPTACSTIGHAISHASSGDTVMIAAATYSENLTINSNINLKLTGSGASSTIIDGGGNGRVISILNTKAVVGLSKVTIRNGVAAGGGGILNWGTLTVTNSTVSRNVAGSESSAVGGGIYNSGTLTIANSTISGNSGTSNFMYGGAIFNSGPLTIINSTLSGNTAYGYIGGGGGGIYNSSGSVTIINTTLSGNSAHASGGGGIFNQIGRVTINNATLSGNTAAGYKGGGIFVTKGATVILQNSIVASSSTAGNCYGTLTSHGYNLSSDYTCNFHGSGDRNNIAARLGTLGSYGGPTQTIPLLSGGPAVDAGNPSGCTDGQGHLLKTDQRGQPRPDKEDQPDKLGCDMGAYERQSD